MRLIFDTSVVRNYIHQTKPYPDLNLLKNYQPKIAVSIADPSFAELLIALLEKRIDFEKWKLRIYEFDSAIDPYMPISPGGHDFALLAGVIEEPPRFKDDSKLYYQAAWKFLKTARSLEDFKKGLVYKNSSGFKEIKADESLFKKIDEDRDYWIKFFQDFNKFSKETGFSKNQIKYLSNLGLPIKEGYSLQAKEKLDPLYQSLLQFIEMAIKENSPYNPESPKRRGDIFDFSLLFILALPLTIICSGDIKFVNRIRQIKSEWIKRLINIEELNRYLQNKSFHKIVEQ